MTLLTYKEAADLLRISPVTLRRWASERRIPFLKLGGAVRFDSDELGRWLEDQRIKATGAVSDDS